MWMVLLVGDDELLLETRAAVVRTTGAATMCCPASSALTIQEGSESDLVILCHTLSGPHCDTLTEAIHSRWPSTRILQLVPSVLSENDGPIDGVATVGAADPARLLGRIIELLGRRPSGQAGHERPSQAILRLRGQL